jgi:hypothetical protein
MFFQLLLMNKVIVSLCFFFNSWFASKQHTEINRENLIWIEISSLSRQKFWKCQDFLDCGDLLFDRVEIVSLDRDKSRKLDLDRYISTVETKILKVSRFSRLWRLTFWSCWDRESWSRHNRENLIWIEISQLSRQKFWKCQDFFDCGDLLFDSVEIESLDRDKSRKLDLDRDISTVETKILKVSRFSRLWRFTFWQCWDRESRSRQIEKTWSRSIYLNCRDKDFGSVEIFSTVEIYFLTVLRSRVSIETQSRKLDLDRDISTAETKILKVSRFFRLWRLTFWQCWDRESRSSHNRDKSRPAGLEIIQKTVCRIMLLSQQYNDDTITQGNPIFMKPNSHFGIKRSIH